MSVTPPPKIDLALLPTPLMPLRRLSAALGGPTIWLKRDDLTGVALSGNKVRKLEYVIADAVARGCDTLITCGGVQSNHCRATAVAGARLGLNVHLLLGGAPPGPGAGAPDGNLFLDALAGARIDYAAPEAFEAGWPGLLEELAAAHARAGRKAAVIPVGASNEVGVWGYAGTARELCDDAAAAGFELGTVVCVTGSGGTQAGLLAGLHLQGNADARVIGMSVAHSAAEMAAKISGDLAAWSRRYDTGLDPAALTIDVREETIGEGYAIAGPKVFEEIARTARLEGVFLDPVYTGKAFVGLLDLIRSGALAGERDVVFVHTGGLFGLMAQREQVARAVLR